MKYKRTQKKWAVESFTRYAEQIDKVLNRYIDEPDNAAVRIAYKQYLGTLLNSVKIFRRYLRKKSANLPSVPKLGKQTFYRGLFGLREFCKACVESYEEPAADYSPEERAIAELLRAEGLTKAAIARNAKVDYKALFKMQRFKELFELKREEERIAREDAKSKNERTNRAGRISASDATYTPNMEDIDEGIDEDIRLRKEQM